jgi:hypothetical protein
MKIFKYSLSKPRTRIEVPRHAQIIHVREQSGIPTIWMYFNTPYEALTEFRTFVWVGTGNEIENTGSYVGTCFCDPFVWHIFEV